MKLSVYMLAVCLFLVSCGGGKKNQQTTTITENEPERKVLVVYYSLTGNTENVAKQIQNRFGGDLFKIEIEDNYPADEQETIEIIKQEKETDFVRPIKRNVDNFQQYDVVFVGTPIWYGTAAPPVQQFIEMNDFAGKTVIPFYTCGGGNADNYIRDIKLWTSDATILNSIGSTRADRENEVSEEKIENQLTELTF